LKKRSKVKGSENLEVVMSLERRENVMSFEERKKTRFNSKRKD